MGKITRSQWQLPAGVTRGVWDYIQADHIAAQYDDYFDDHRLMQLDLQIARQFIPPRGVLADLGCGTGRALLPLVQDGRQGIAVDLSAPMLAMVQKKFKQAELPVQCLRANLVDLRCLAGDSIDNAICLFSTLGMIQGHENRRDVVHHIHRILTPGGVFIVHVHNLWHNLLDPKGPWWLLGNLARSRGRLGHGRGDRQYDYRGIRNFYLHAFTRRELTGMLREAGFDIERMVLIGRSSDGRLGCPWLLGAVRAQGWIVVCRKSM